MKVVVAIDSFKGSLSSMEAGAAIAEGIHRVSKDIDVQVRPLADGGEGTVEALTAGMNGKTEHVSVTGPLGNTVEASYGIIAETKTAIIEMAAAAGITLLAEKDRNPLYTTTYGVGELIQDAIKKVAGILLWASEAAPPMTVEWECFRHWAMTFWMQMESRFLTEQKGLR